MDRTASLYPVPAGLTKEKMTQISGEDLIRLFDFRLPKSHLSYRKFQEKKKGGPPRTWEKVTKEQIFKVPGSSTFTGAQGGAKLTQS